MNKVKAYFLRQASRPHTALAHDFVVVGGLIACVYFGWIH